MSVMNLKKAFEVLKGTNAAKEFRGKQLELPSPFEQAHKIDAVSEKAWPVQRQYARDVGEAELAKLLGEEEAYAQAERTRAQGAAASSVQAADQKGNPAQPAARGVPIEGKANVAAVKRAEEVPARSGSDDALTFDQLEYETKYKKSVDGLRAEIERMENGDLNGAGTGHIETLKNLLASQEAEYAAVYGEYERQATAENEAAAQRLPGLEDRLARAQEAGDENQTKTLGEAYTDTALGILSRTKNIEDFRETLLQPIANLPAVDLAGVAGSAQDGQAAQAGQGEAAGFNPFIAEYQKVSERFNRIVQEFQKDIQNKADLLNKIGSVAGEMKALENQISDARYAKGSLTSAVEIEWAEDDISILTGRLEAKQETLDQLNEYKDLFEEVEKVRLQVNVWNYLSKVDLDEAQGMIGGRMDALIERELSEGLGDEAQSFAAYAVLTGPYDDVRRIQQINARGGKLAREELEAQIAQIGVLKEALDYSAYFDAMRELEATFGEAAELVDGEPKSGEEKAEEIFEGWALNEATRAALAAYQDGLAGKTDLVGFLELVPDDEAALGDLEAVNVKVLRAQKTIREALAKSRWGKQVWELVNEVDADTALRNLDLYAQSHSGVDPALIAQLGKDVKLIQGISLSGAYLSEDEVASRMGMIGLMDADLSQGDTDAQIGKLREMLLGEPAQLAIDYDGADNMIPLLEPAGQDISERNPNDELYLNAVDAVRQYYEEHSGELDSDAYNLLLKAAEYYGGEVTQWELLPNLNLTAVDGIIKDLESQLKAMEAEYNDAIPLIIESKQLDYDETRVYQDEIDAALETEARYEGLKSLITFYEELKEKTLDARKVNDYSSALDAADFKKVSQEGRRKAFNKLNTLGLGNAPDSYNYITQEERAVYDYWYAKEGRSAADEYLKSLTPFLNERYMFAAGQSAQEFAEGYPGLSDVASIALAVVELPIDLAVLAKTLLNKGIDPNDPLLALPAFINTIREVRMEDIRGGVGSERAGNLLADAYGLTMDVADMVAAYYAVKALSKALAKPVQAQKGLGAKAENIIGKQGTGKTTLSDWTGKTGELAKTSPVKIPESATVKAGTKVAGYDQISYKWSESGYTYEARWHTKTPGAPVGQSNTWVVSRVTPGTPAGQQRVIHIMVGDTWVTSAAWQDAIKAYQNATMTAAQEEMLKAGHWLAP